MKKKKQKPGRPARFKGKTTQVKFTPPISKVPELKKVVTKLFDKWIEDGV